MYFEYSCLKKKKGKKLYIWFMWPISLKRLLAFNDEDNWIASGQFRSPVVSQWSPMWMWCVISVPFPLCVRHNYGILISAVINPTRRLTSALISIQIIAVQNYSLTLFQSFTLSLMVLYRPLLCHTMFLTLFFSPSKVKIVYFLIFFIGNLRYRDTCPAPHELEMGFDSTILLTRVNHLTCSISNGY